MIDTPRQHDRLLRLIERYCEQRLEPTDIHELEQILDADDEARSIFLHYMAQHARLTWRMRDRPADRIARTTRPALVPQAQLGSWPWIAAAAMLVAALGLGLMIRSWLAPQSTTTSTPHARVVMSVDALWEGTRFHDGTEIGAAPQVLRSGMVQLQMPSGTSVVIEGPTRFSITGSNSLRLFSGRVHADVPLSGHGFTVETNTGRFVDLGTRFSVVATTKGSTELHVIDGKVEAYTRDAKSDAGPPQTLTAGSGLQVDPTGQIKSIPAKPHHYVDASRMLQLKLRDDYDRQAIKGQARDPELAILLDFEKEIGHPLRNLATGYARASVPNHWLHSYTGGTTRSRTPLTIGRWVRYKHLGPDAIRLEVEDQGGPPHDDLIVEMRHNPTGQTHIWARKRTSKSPPGFTHELETADRRSIFGPITGSGTRWTIDTPKPAAIRLIGVDTTEGRRPFSQAVLFNQKRSRVVVPMVQTKVTAFTVSAWVYLEPSDALQPLIVPVGIPQTADWSWVIDSKGRLALYTRTVDGPNHFYAAKPLPTGRWIHIATIYDADHQLVTHVINGKAYPTEGLSRLPEDISIGPIQIGRDVQSNQFAGRIDDVAVWVRAVSVDQLQRLYAGSTAQHTSP